jgi:SAM-dependent methyltransferase
MRGDELWESNAHWWQESFTRGGDPEYEEQILPLAALSVGGARRILDLGCGEGQLSRRMVREGVGVVGLDPVSSQIHEAERRGGATFARARAQEIPCRGNAFDAVVMCLALEHIDPFEPVIQEVARVLEPGGRFVLILSHPLLQAPGSGWVVHEGTGEHYWRVGSYLTEDVAIDEVSPGVHFSFVHRPLSRYVHALGEAGLLIDDMTEPVPIPAVVSETGGFSLAPSIPRVLMLTSRKVTMTGDTAALVDPSS